MINTDVIEKCLAVLKQECDDPAMELIKMGNALMVIGNAVKGLSYSDARAVIIAAAQLASITKPEP